MPRKVRESKPLIRVFCEGESEQAYTKFLKEEFEDVAVIKYPKATGLFDKAVNDYRKEPSLRSEIDVLDEIWFFFDVEEDDRPKWEQRFEVIQTLRKLRKKEYIRVRLLMTTACIEYWFLLHYKLTMPHISSVAEKEGILRQVRAEMPGYEKGDQATTFRIAANYRQAAEHGTRVLEQLQQEGLPTLEDTDERNLWLCRCGLTFTTVQEAIRFLASKSPIH